MVRCEHGENGTGAVCQGRGGDHLLAAGRRADGCPSESRDSQPATTSLQGALFLLPRPRCFPRYVRGISLPLRKVIFPTAPGWIAFVEKYVQTSLAGDDNIRSSIAVHIPRTEFHARTDDIIRRRFLIFLDGEIRRDIAVSQDMPLEMTFVEFVIEDELRIERTDIQAIVGKHLLPGDQFRLAVAIQVGQDLGVDGWIVRLYPVLRKSTFA